jgi:hypothetical protein
VAAEFSINQDILGVGHDYAALLLDETHRVSVLG